MGKKIAIFSRPKTKKLAIFYNTSTDYLLGLTDERKPYPKSILKK